jgi:hypothetical protein
MNFSSYCKLFAIVMLAFLLCNLLVWKCWTEDLLTKKYAGGDLVRTGYVHGSREFRQTRYDLPRRHIEMSGYHGQPVDVMTIGDSFSYGGGEGRNSYYQDYIASFGNLSVLNVFSYPTDDLFVGFSPISTLAVLCNSGYLDRIRPRIVLIESVERYCLIRFAKPFRFNQTDTLENVIRYYRTDHGSRLYQLPDVGFLNEGNIKFLYASLVYRFRDTVSGKVCLRDLSRPFFSVPNERKLLFLREDVQNIPFANRDTVGRLNDNFNRLADILAAKGIRLYFMPVVDKYDLYSEYIVKNPYPGSVFFEELRKLPRRYTLIDTKAILRAEVDRGEKDVFHADDTHWSGKASRKVFETVRIR